VRLAFLGNGEFGVPVLEALLGSSHNLTAVVTRSDRPAGRGRAPEPSPIKEAARRTGTTVVEVSDLKDPETRNRLVALEADCWVVVAFPILPRILLDVPPHGIINLHASLLPRYRGAAPIQWALIRGERVTGVTTFLIDAGIDTGAICLQRELAIEPGENAGELAVRLARTGAALMVETLDRLQRGDLPRLPQDPARATPAPKLEKEEGLLDWTLAATDLVNRVRGLNPWPGTWTFFGPERILVRRAGRAGPPWEPLTAAPGTVAAFLESGEPVVAAGGGSGVVLLEAQRAGRRPATGSELARGLRWRGGERLGGGGLPEGD
jgi:methionyl-tRNA formyltransferase